FLQKEEAGIFLFFSRPNSCSAILLVWTFPQFANKKQTCFYFLFLISFLSCCLHFNLFASTHRSLVQTKSSCLYKQVDLDLDLLSPERSCGQSNFTASVCDCSSFGIHPPSHCHLQSKRRNIVLV